MATGGSPADVSKVHFNMERMFERMMAKQDDLSTKVNSKISNLREEFLQIDRAREEMPSRHSRP